MGVFIICVGTSLKEEKNAELLCFDRNKQILCDQNIIHLETVKPTGDWTTLDVQELTVLNVPNPYIVLNQINRMQRLPTRGRPRGSRLSSSSQIPGEREASQSTVKLYGCPYCPYSSKYAYSVYPHVRKRHSGSNVYCINLKP